LSDVCSESIGCTGAELLVLTAAEALTNGLDVTEAGLCKRRQ